MTTLKINKLNLPWTHIPFNLKSEYIYIYKLEQRLPLFTFSPINHKMSVHPFGVAVESKRKIFSVTLSNALINLIVFDIVKNYRARVEHLFEGHTRIFWFQKTHADDSQTRNKHGERTSNCRWVFRVLGLRTMHHEFDHRKI